MPLFGFGKKQPKRPDIADPFDYPAVFHNKPLDHFVPGHGGFIPQYVLDDPRSRNKFAVVEVTRAFKEGHPFPNNPPQPAGPPPGMRCGKKAGMIMFDEGWKYPLVDREDGLGPRPLPDPPMNRGQEGGGAEQGGAPGHSMHGGHRSGPIRGAGRFNPLDVRPGDSVRAQSIRDGEGSRRDRFGEARDGRRSSSGGGGGRSGSSRGGGGGGHGGSAEQSSRR